jgi:hypothetical protein
VLGLQRFDAFGSGCIEFNEVILREIDRRKIPNVWLHARWALYVEGRRASARRRPAGATDRRR